MFTPSEPIAMLDVKENSRHQDTILFLQINHFTPLVEKYGSTPAGRRIDNPVPLVWLTPSGSFASKTAGTYRELGDSQGGDSRTFGSVT